MTEEARAPQQEPSGDGEPSARRPRRRRRGGRGRGRGPRSVTTQTGDTTGSTTSDASPAEAPPAGPPADSTDGGESGSTQTTPRSRTSGAKSSSNRRRRPASSSSSRTREKPAEGAGEETSAGDAQERGTDSEGEGDAKPRPSSRSRSRSRRPKPKPAEGEGGETTATESSPATETDNGAEPAEGSASSTSRRRRRRKKPSENGGDGDAPQTQTRPQRKKPEEKRAAPPTRTSRTRKRGTVTRRRREPDIRPERRLDKVMLITEHGERDQIVVVEGTELAEHYVTRSHARSMVGNIYIGKVQNVLPGMEAAFVDVGKGRNAVLYAGEVSYDEETDEDARRIEQALKPGQSVLVQVTKDPIGGKGARLTGQVSVPGRYLVYVPDGGASGISRRLPESERTRLRGIMKDIRPSGAGVIVRTAAEGASAEGIAGDLERLKKLWDSIKRKSRRGKVPRLIYEEPELTVRVVRDVFSPVEFREIVIDSPAVYERVTEYLRDVAPDLLDKVRLHEGTLPILEEFHVHEQIHKAIERKVWLSSGGYLIFDRTEAMTVIDVNTGKAVGKSNLEETVVQTNLEAAKEIARQLRLRDIGGIIVIDFIDMLLQANRSKVIRTLKEEMAQDRTRSQVFDITPLGLLEVTRKRVSAGLVEAFSETCPTCDGRGILVNLEP